VSDEHSKSQNATVIKKYANRRLYNTATSTYVTLEDLAQMVRGGQDFVVYDAKSGEEITRSVLTQIIFEEENKGSQNLLPINFLRQLIRFYGDTMQGVVPSYLEMSLDTLMKDQDKIRKQVTDALGVGMPGPMMGAPFGADAVKTMEEITRRNMSLFQDAMRTFNPFAAAMGMGQQPPKPGQEPPKSHEAAKPAQKAEPGSDDFAALRDQMAAMQQKLERLLKPE
jgi:polyhydroxyalkanoate synthesis repressor PhaR